MRAERDGPAERRAEPRRPANGEVTFRPADGLVFVGSLMDIARSGFRAGHGRQTLRPNQELDFEIADFAGRARVVWTRILGSQVESGFLILARQDDGAEPEAAA